MLLSLLAAAAFAGTPDADAAALTGAWRLAEPRPTVQARVDAAIEATLAPFNIVIRGMARGPLGTAAVFCDTYRLVASEQAFTVACDGGASAKTAYGDPAVAGEGPTGRAYKLSSTWNDAAILTFAAADGFQRVTYRADGGDRLLVHKVIHSDRLGGDVSWEMVYVRER